MPGLSAHGALIEVSPDPNWPDFDPVGGSTDFVPIAELRDITAPPLTRKAIETTTHNEDDDQFIVGVRRHGDLSFDMNFLPRDETHDHLTGLQKLWFDGDRVIIRLTYPDGASGTQWLFSGFVTSIGATLPVDDRLAAPVTLRPTGKHDWNVNP